MKRFNYSNVEEVNYFKEVEKKLKQRLRIGDKVSVVKPHEYTTGRADTPSGFDLFKTEGSYYRCVVDVDDCGNLITKDCEYVEGLKWDFNNELLRHLVASGLAVTKRKE